MKRNYLCKTLKVPLYLVLVLACFSLQGCSDAKHNDNPPVPASSQAPNNPEAIIDTDIEYHLDNMEDCRVDVRIPCVKDSLPGADELNNVLYTDFNHLREQEDISTWEHSEGYPYTWHQYDYTFVEFDGVYCISVFNTISSAYGSSQPWRWVWSYYYDANQGKMLSVEEFLDSIGYTKDDIILSYIEDCCPACAPDEIAFEKILFYFGECKNLKFIYNSAARIGYATPNI